MQRRPGLGLRGSCPNVGCPKDKGVSKPPPPIPLLKNKQLLLRTGRRNSVAVRGRGETRVPVAPHLLEADGDVRKAGTDK